MKRNIDYILLKWKANPKRKVLLVRGARQVGKTYSVRRLGNRFENLVEVNFEERPELAEIFKINLVPDNIIQKLSIFFEQPIIPGKTLLFFDEIQECPHALRALRFFYEKMPELHVIAAGSLLEFTLSEIPSFGVGRIESLFMYPLTFYEFLEAEGQNALKELILDISIKKPLDPVFHNKALDFVKIFQIIGGMPEIVREYIETNNFIECQKLQDNLISSLYDDFAKYKNRSPVMKIREVFRSIVFQTGNKFKYSNVTEGGITGYKEALELLIHAGLAYKVHHSDAGGIPLGAQINLKKFKVLIFDTGIFQRVSRLNLSAYITDDFQSLVNKGDIVEAFVGLELIKNQPPNSAPELHYWHREAKSSNAEVDFVISLGNKIFPLEVKAGAKGQMQSLHLFLKERDLDKGFRVSGEIFSEYDKITALPVYAAGKLIQESKY